MQRSVCGGRLLAGKFSPAQTSLSSDRDGDGKYTAGVAESLCNVVIPRLSRGWVIAGTPRFSAGRGRLHSPAPYSPEEFESRIG